MTRARINLEPAYVLARRAFRDTSLLIEAFTEHHGRVGLVARGVRGAKSQKSALLQPLRPLLISWVESGELGTLTGVEANGFVPEFAGERLLSGWYLNELLSILLQRHDPHPELFVDYARALEALASQPVEIPLRKFELKLLAETGYGLNLPGVMEPQAHYVYDWVSGPQPSSPGPGTFTGDSLIALRDGELTEVEHLRAARRLLREALRRQLNGRELKTPKLLRELRAAAGNTPAGETE
jgi:DNA repair protein RecO (recombination protein O)